MQLPQFTKITWCLLLVPIVLITIFFCLQFLVLGIQNIVIHTKDYVEIGCKSGNCSGHTSQKRVYFPVGSSYVSFGSTDGGILKSLTIQLLPKHIVEKVVAVARKSQNSKIDYTYLGLTPEKVKQNWLTAYADESCAILRAHKLEPDYSALPKILKMPFEVDRYSYSFYYVKIARTMPVLITLRGSLPWTICTAGSAWNTYDENVGEAMKLLLFPDDKALEEVMFIDKASYWSVDQQKFWSNLRRLTLGKHAQKIISKDAPLSANRYLYLSEIILPGNNCFNATLRPIKGDSIIDEVSVPISIYNNKILPHWESSIQEYQACENCVETIQWLHDWKKMKTHPTFRLYRRFVSCSSSSRELWRRQGLDSYPDWTLQILYKGQIRGSLITSEAGNKVYCWVDPTPAEMNKASLLGTKVKGGTFLLSKKDALPDALANILQPN
ncbi:MAG: hypothetical protein K2W82_04850 [Candidatus Obscuribacterales bacterium]|nr:hypothetical protein [Candidatus Obscuribacterales bacterium]